MQPSSFLVPPIPSTPAVIYQPVDIGSPHTGRLRAGWEMGESIVVPLVTLSASITLSQTARTQTWIFHNSLIPHTQRALQKLLWGKQLDFQGPFASIINSIFYHKLCFKGHNFYSKILITAYAFLFSLFISGRKKKVVRLGPVLLRILRVLQKTRISSFGRAKLLRPLEDEVEKNFISMKSKFIDLAK